MYSLLTKFSLYEKTKLFAGNDSVNIELKLNVIIGLDCSISCSDCLNFFFSSVV